MTTPFPFVSGAVLTAQELNDIQNLPISDKTADYVLLVGDVTKRTIMDAAGATTITVDDSIFTEADVIQVANKGAGVCTITAGAGVTINSASGLALVTSQSGQLVALSASSFLFVASDTTSGVVQVKSTTKTDTFTMSSTTFADVTGLSVAITPTSATNKIFVVVTMNTGNNTGGLLYARLLRDSTDLALGDTAGNRTRVTGSVVSASTGETQPLSMSFLDSPATTSALTYKVQIAASAAVQMAVNRSHQDNDAANRSRGSSTITVFEVTP